MKTLADRLQFIINKRGLSQNDVAKICNIRQGSVSYILSNNIKKSKLSNDIAKGLGISHEWLAEGKGTINEIKSYTIPLFNNVVSLITALKNPDDIDYEEYIFTSNKNLSINSFCFQFNKLFYTCKKDVIKQTEKGKSYLNILDILDIFNETISIEKNITGAISFEILEIRIPLVENANIKELGNLYDKQN